MNISIILFILLILILIIILIIIRLKLFIKIDNFENKKIILTYTTFLDFKKKDKFKCLIKSIDSIISNHTNSELNIIDKFIIINEYSDNPLNDWAKIIKEKYPFIEFIQKNKNQRGQVYSLNMILDIISEYEYWIHIEESWYCIRPLTSF